MIRIEVKNASYKSKSGSKNGNPWTMNFQQIYIHGYYQDGFPSDSARPSSIQLDKDNPQPYAVGLYSLSDESFYFGEFDRLTLGRMKLVPLAEYLKQLKEDLGSNLKAAA